MYQDFIIDQHLMFCKLTTVCWQIRNWYKNVPPNIRKMVRNSKGGLCY